VTTRIPTGSRLAIHGAVERQVRERFPMIKRLFIETGSAPPAQRWSRPDAIRTPIDLSGTPASS
jgi:hypothetical protein